MWFFGSQGDLGLQGLVFDILKLDPAGAKVVGGAACVEHQCLFPKVQLHAGISQPLGRQDGTAAICASRYWAGFKAEAENEIWEYLCKLELERQNKLELMRQLQALMKEKSKPKELHELKVKLALESAKIADLWKELTKVTKEADGHRTTCCSLEKMVAALKDNGTPVISK